MANKERLANIKQHGPPKPGWLQSTPWVRHHLSSEWFARLFAGVCDICGRNDRPMTVDHDHSCCPTGASCGKCVRAILCQRCNTRMSWVDANLPGILRLIG
jgi:hypothetical protein